MKEDVNGLRQDHHPHAIAARLSESKKHSYLGDGILGAIDGSVTTFAVVSGVVGANLSSSIILILGFANLVADGFSMAVSNYQKTKHDRQRVEHFRRVEGEHIDEIPEGEREEIRQIFSRKGFAGDLLEEIVAIITRDRERWIDTMLTEELGLQLEGPSPWKAGLATFVAFFVVGLIPLMPFLFVGNMERNVTFLISCIATAFSFLLIGFLKGKVLSESLWRSSLETLFVGCAAAGLAYLVGALLRDLGNAL